MPSLSTDLPGVIPDSASPKHRTRSTCRVCGGSEVRCFLSLGTTPLANSFLSSPEQFAAEARFPLNVYFCETCSLVQLLEVIDPQALFGNYVYVTGTSDTIAAHNQELAREIVGLVNPVPRDLVVEVASNDGSLLRCFKPYGMRTLGIEPAANIAEIARAGGVETLDLFFKSAVAEQVRSSFGRAKVVIGNNVLGHVDDPVDFLRGCKELLDEEGILVVEVPYLRDLIERLEFDTIYHEHLSYFSATALIHLCDSTELSILRMDYVPVHGGSLRMYAGLPRHYDRHAREALELAEQEQHMGLTGSARYERFAHGVVSLRKALRDMLQSLREAGKTVAGYGAPAKGNTLLNYCSVTPDLVRYTVDKNSLKVGLYTPGMHIPVFPVSTLLERQPDYVLILAWNFAEEVMRQQQEYRTRGGRFIIPIPEPVIV